MPYVDKDNNLKFLHLCVMMDVFSRKIIGFSFSESENHIMIIECIKMAFERYKLIPKHIIHDNHSAYKSQEFKKLSNCLDDYGVILRNSTPGNPKDKGHVERWFNSFNSYYLNRLIGNLGEGIKSKTEGGRAPYELEILYKSKPFLRNKELLIKTVSALIKEYNSKKEEDHSFKQSNIKFRQFKEWDIAKLFYRSGLRKVRRSMIFITIGKKNYSYTITDFQLANKTNGEYVLIRYDEDFPYKIFLFTSKSNRYLGMVKADQPIDIIPDNNHKKIITKHNHLIRQRIQKVFDSLVEDIDSSTLELESLPTVQVFNSKENLNKILSQAEDQFLISEMIDIQYQKPKKKRKSTDKKSQYLSNKLLRKMKYKKIEIIR
ncbi:DDE-type integrase/transposase/recombinase [uncultured Aquimarina sp.]|uniref:DDE-type integrase/transposase/recombinase n=1 Tax=uncultured Aquimarina sp. TaxID=575652 RepID=UPI003459A5DC